MPRGGDAMAVRCHDARLARGRGEIRAVRRLRMPSQMMGCPAIRSAPEAQPRRAVRCRASPATDASSQPVAHRNQRAVRVDERECVCAVRAGFSPPAAVAFSLRVRAPARGRRRFAAAPRLHGELGLGSASEALSGPWRSGSMLSVPPPGRAQVAGCGIRASARPVAPPRRDGKRASERSTPAIRAGAVARIRQNVGVALDEGVVPARTWGLASARASSSGPASSSRRRVSGTVKPARRSSSGARFGGGRGRGRAASVSKRAPPATRARRPRARGRRAGGALRRRGARCARQPRRRRASARGSAAARCVADSCGRSARRCSCRRRAR